MGHRLRLQGRRRGFRESVGQGPGQHRPSPPASHWLRRPLAPNQSGHRAAGPAQDAPGAAGVLQEGTPGAAPSPQGAEPPRPLRSAGGRDLLLWEAAPSGGGSGKTQPLQTKGDHPAWGPDASQRAWTGTILLLRAPKWSPEREGTPQLQATAPPARPAPANLPFRPVGTQRPAPSSSSRKPGPPRLTRGSRSSPPRAHGRSSSWTGSSPRGSGTDWGQFSPASSPPQLPGAPPGLSGAAVTSPFMGKLSSGDQPRHRVDAGHHHLILTSPAS